MRREVNPRLIEQPLCRISYWQGYVTGQYYACEVGVSRPLSCSATFRTWTLRRGNADPHSLPVAKAALKRLAAELDAGGWRVLGHDGATDVPAAEVEAVVVPVRDADALNDEAILGALTRVGHDGGATAAEVGRALLGDEATDVGHMPQRVAAKLRRLQIQGKVERRANGRTASWFPLHRVGD